MMKQRFMRKRLLFMVLGSILSVFITFSSGALLAVASQPLPSGLVIGDETGVYASSEGEYYVDLPNVLPGEIYEKTITIRSLDVKEPFELGLLVSPISSVGIIDFHKNITLTLSLDGKELYHGPLLGNGQFDWTVQPLVIGTCEYGKDQILTAIFEVSKDLTIQEFQKDSQLTYQWSFIATKNQPDLPQTSSSVSADRSKSKGLLPKTGEEIKNLIYKLLAGLLLLLIAILLWKKRKDEQQSAE